MAQYFPEAEVGPEAQAYIEMIQGKVDLRQGAPDEPQITYSWSN
jgi:hypothetical protein